MKKKTKDELGEDICNHCACTDYGNETINTGPHNLCEGGWCDEAYENYLENYEEDEE